jgi:phage shock protein C
MFCPQCGKQVEPGSRFCPACGTAVASVGWQPRPTGPTGPTGPMMRPLTNRMIGGVCAAFALHYGWELNAVRVITCLIILMTGVGALAYLAAWVIIPQEPYPIHTKSI